MLLHHYYITRISGSRPQLPLPLRGRGGHVIHLDSRTLFTVHDNWGLMCSLHFSLRKLALKDGVSR